MKRCKLAAKGNRGAHDLSVIVPNDADNPVLLVCMRCGEAIRHEIALVGPMAADDMPSDLLERITRGHA